MEPIKILWKQLNEMAVSAIQLLPQLAVALLVLFITWAATKLSQRFIGGVLRKTKLRPSLKELFSLLLTIGIWVLGIMVAAVIVFPGLTPASILAGLGIGSVAIGFAFKDVFENFLAGIIILFRKEMRIGDYIECEGIKGVVEDISVRESQIMQTDGELVIVPNFILFKNPVTVLTHNDKRRVTVICGVGYGEDVDAARDVIREAVKSCESVIQDGKPVQIFAQEFGDSSINFEVTWWTGSKPVDVRTSRDEVVASVKRALDNAGIEIPFPYRTLTFSEPLSVHNKASEGES